MSNLSSDTSFSFDSLSENEDHTRSSSANDAGNRSSIGNEEEQLSQLRGDVPSDPGKDIYSDASNSSPNSSSSGGSPSSSTSSGGSPSSSSSGGCPSSSSSGGSPSSSSSGDRCTAELSRLKRRRHYSSSSSSDERLLSVIQSQTHLYSGFTNSGTPDTHQIAESRLGHQEETPSHADPGSILGNLELGPDSHPSYEAMPSSRSSSSSEGELTRSRALQQRHHVGEVQDLSTSSLESSDIEGEDDGRQPRSITEQEVDLELREPEVADKMPTFDYRSKVLPLTSQELRSFVFHDLTITHHVPRIAVQAFSSLYTSGGPSDPRTTKRRMECLTGLAEVRYDCCVEGCISYSLPRYADLTKCPINGCGRARYKPDRKPYAQHTYIPISHRLQLMYSDKERAREMMTYRAKMDEEMNTDVCSTYI